MPGPLRQVTGGYLYDARIVDGLRAAGWPVGVLDIRSQGWTLDAAAGRRLVNGLGRERWSAVVIDELAHPALVAALAGGRLRAALNGAPLVLLVHHLRSSEPAGWPMRTLARLVERLAMRAADLVVCTSETTARTVRPLARPGVQVAVVRPGWDTHQPSAGPLSTAGRGPLPPTPISHHGAPQLRRLPTAPLRWRGGNETPCTPLPRTGEGLREGATTPTLRLLLVGHWTPRKGILLALEALAHTPPGITLSLVGEQDRDLVYAAKVRAMLQQPGLAGRVRAHGRVPAETLTWLFADADALLLPSTHEGYGMVLAEALAAGLPIIATRVGAVPEVVRDGQEAILVPPDDASALAQAIEQMAASPEDRQRRAVLALERAQSLPTWAESIGTFTRLLHDLMRTPQGA
ncbi:MAG: glycosyltransferase family 4 protein [Chloroflexota bacterium]